MKDTLLKILKVSLIVLGVLLACLLVAGLVLLLDWPRWVAVFLVLIVLGIAIGVLLLRKLLLRKREQNFVQQVIAQDEARIKTLSEKDRGEMKELQERWKEAVDALRKSHLRKHGNPLYVLPWYLVMGESGSGKTTSISSAKLSSPFAEVTRTSGISGTRNADWWFFEQAVIIDTAGRYAIPVDEGRDKDEWQKFLSLLVKYRKKEPIHGLIVTVAADKLLQAAPEAMEQDGKNIRRRVDELMRVLGVRFPVYVLVTKCDLVQGMARFCDQLPEKSLEQPMGFVNQDLSKDVAGFVDKAMSSLGERLRSMRVLLLHKPEAKGVDPAFLLFPEEFANLGKGLKSFMQAAFQENPYQETPILRGLHFSSGRQEGTPFSHFLSALGLIGEKDVLPGTNKGLFLHDFYARILPGDRRLFAPTKRALEWRTLTRNLGLTAWIVLGIALCGLLSFSFVKNLKIVREVSHDFDKPVSLRGEMLSDLVAMDRFKEGILKVERQNQGWWIPRFGLNESRTVEIGLKRKYCKQFEDGFLTAFDKQLGGAVSSLGPGASDEVAGQYIVHLARRINILQARIDGSDLPALQARPQPPYVGAGAQEIEPEVRKKFGDLYLYDLVWRQNPGDLKKEMELLQVWLRHVVALRGKGLQWVVAWTDRQSGLPGVTLAEYWGGGPQAGDKGVGASFTRKGKEFIDGLVQEVGAASGEPAGLSAQKAEFDRWYRGAAFEAWAAFGYAFPRGADRLRGAKEWQQMAGRMTGDQGPFPSLLSRMATELEPLIGGGDGIPGWVGPLYQFQAIRMAAEAARDKGAVGKAAEGGMKLISEVVKKLGRDVTGQAAVAQATKAYQEYHDALSSATPMTQSRNQALQMASQTFSEDAATGKSPLHIASSASARVRSALGGGGELVGKLVAGPIDFLWAYARSEAACALQAQWEEKVLAEAQGASGAGAGQLLLGPEGLVWKFVRGPAAPFLGRSLQRGYQAKEVLGGGIPFEPAFLAFLSKAAVQAAAAAAAPKQSSYPVQIKGLPTDANPEARMKPQTTRLELRCATGSQTLINQNYPVGKTFTWAPEACNDVIFQIEVGDVVIVKKYLGDQGFPQFLRDFQGGKRVFYPNEFPAVGATLERYGIKYIRVNYQFTGDRAVLSHASGAAAAGGGAPRSIARCWAP